MKKLLCVLMLFATILVSLTSCFDGGGWGFDFDKDGSDDFQVPVLGVPTPKSYKIRFETNGGSSVATKVLVSLDSAPHTQRENHAFQGWYRDAGLQIPVVYPFFPEGETVLYAKWLRVYDKSNCVDVELDAFDKDLDGSVLFDITPSRLRLDLQELSKEGYSIQIKITYDVRYKKTYDVPFDIGYAGAPKYQVELIQNQRYIMKEQSGTAPSSFQTKTITYSAYASEYIGENYYLVFSTKNVQNSVWFSNITIEYVCQK